MEGKKVKKSDVHKIVHFAKVTNMMDDTTRIRFHIETKNVKAGTLKFNKKTVGSMYAASKMNELSSDMTRWYPHLIRRFEISSKTQTSIEFTKKVLRNLFIDRKLHVKRNRVKGIIT